MRIKICGATHPSDVDLLAGAGIDLIGLWHGIPDGPADLSMQELVRLAAAARANGPAPPVLVTLLSEIDVIRTVVLSSGVRWVQLHGYQTPAVVRGLKTAGPPGLTVIKVLHIRDGDCLEHGLVRAYERAGVDFFLLDTVNKNGRIGSTGKQLDCAVVPGLADQMSRPFFLAGGISAENRADYDQVIDHPRFFGIDVDTHARGTDGRLHPGRVAAIRQHWQAGADQNIADQKVRVW